MTVFPASLNHLKGRITLDLPPPPSVNKTRRLNKAALPLIKKWKEASSKTLMAAWTRGRRPLPITGKFEARLILDDADHHDLDNVVKVVIDYARRLELITDDSPRFMRRVVIEWGDVPWGCRLILTPVD